MVVAARRVSVGLRINTSDKTPALTLHKQQPTRETASGSRPSQTTHGPLY